MDGCNLRKDLLLADDVETVLDGCVDGFKLFQLKNSRIVSMMCSVEARVEGLCKVRRSCLPTDWRHWSSTLVMYSEKVYVGGRRPAVVETFQNLLNIIGRKNWLQNCLSLFHWYSEKLILKICIFKMFSCILCMQWFLKEKRLWSIGM